MRKEPPAELIKIFDKLAKDMGAEYYTISTPIICDHCLDDDKEAFPYYVKDRDGKEWAHLCNDCWDELGCAYDYSMNEDEFYDMLEIKRDGIE